jgi:hypothetical protein
LIRKFVLVWFLALVFAAHAAPALPRALALQVERLTQLLRDSHAVGYPAATMAHNIRLGPSAEATVVVFTVEGFGGGNNHTQYLALFSNERGDRGEVYYSLMDVLPIAGNGWRAIEQLRPRLLAGKGGSDPVIEIDALDVGPQDSPNFPSERSVIKLALHAGRLLERQ